MNIKPYNKLKEGELILRDHLANDRTMLANERTFLAYIRTALSFFVVGATVIKFFGVEQAYLMTGALILFIGVIILARGIISYRRINIELSKVSEDHER